MNSEHKQVYVTWPGGNKTGPHTQTFEDYEGDVEVRLHERTVIIPCEWVDPVDPELEDDRPYYATDKDGNKDVYYGMDIYRPEMVRIEPVCKRWDELSEKEKDSYYEVIEHFGGRAIFEYTYELITGEEHP